MKQHSKNKKPNSLGWAPFFSGPKYKISKVVIDGIAAYKMEAL